MMNLAGDDPIDPVSRVSVEKSQVEREGCLVVPVIIDFSVADDVFHASRRECFKLVGGSSKKVRDFVGPAGHGEVVGGRTADVASIAYHGPAGSL